MQTEHCPTAWKMVTLSDLGEVGRGRSRYRPRYAEHLYGGPYPFVQTGDIKASGGRITRYQQTYSEAGLEQSRLWPAGTLCITIAANIAETGILTFPSCFPDSVVGFIADDTKCDVYFVEYMFRHLRSRIQHEASGSVQDNINLAVLDRLRFPLPPLPEQRAIAHILASLDDKIELNRRMNETLEAMARALFQSWFVDFDPVRAKAEGRQPAGMDAETAALFPDGFEESELRKVPRGWEMHKLDPHIDILETGSRPKGGADSEGVPSLGAESVGRLGEFDYSKTKYVNYEFFAAMRKGYVVDGDVLLYKDGGKPGEHPGKKTFVDHGFPFESYCINEHVYRLRVSYPLTQHYLYFWLDTPYATDQIIQRATGVAQPGLNRGAVASLPVLGPSAGVIEAFTDVVRPICDRIFENSKQSRTLAIIRDTLLPKLLSGEVRVKEAEQLIEAQV